MSRWYVYMLECADGTLYTGVTTDLDRRFQEHRQGKGGNYTRSHKPMRLCYSEQASSRSTAQQREAAIKRMSREEKLRIVGLL